MLSVPLLRQGTGAGAIGAISLARSEVRPFTDRQVALIETFADQAGIAIENARLFQELEDRNRDLTAALEQQTATAEVLRVIAGTPTDLQHVLDTIAETAARLCRCDNATILRVDGDRVQTAAAYGALWEHRQEYRVGSSWEPHLPNMREAVNGICVTEGRVVHVPDIFGPEGDPYPLTRERARQIGYRAALTAPLLRQGAVIGTIGVQRTEAGPFAEAEIALLQSFADQAVIAIENTRLFAETAGYEPGAADGDQRGAPGHQPARPRDLQQVLDTIADSAARLCGTDRAVIFRVEGDTYRAVAGLTARRESSHPGERGGPSFRWPGRVSTPPAGAIADGAVVHLHDLAAVPEAELPAARPAHWACAPCWRCRCSGRAWPSGAINLARQEVRPFTDQQIALLETFADQAVIAIENTRLFTELQESNRTLTEALEQQTATSEVLAAISRAPTDLQQVLDTIAESAARLCGTDRARDLPRGGRRLPHRRRAQRRRQSAHAGERAETVRAIRWPARANTAGPRDRGRRRRARPRPRRGARGGAAGAGGLARSGYAPRWRCRCSGRARPSGRSALGRREVRPFTDRQIALVRRPSPTRR